MPDLVGRNEPCPCGSGKKHKHCCLPVRQRKKDRLAAIQEATKELSCGSAEVDDLLTQAGKLARRGKLTEAEAVIAQVRRLLLDLTGGDLSLLRPGEPD